MKHYYNLEKLKRICLIQTVALVVYFLFIILMSILVNKNFASAFVLLIAAVRLANRPRKYYKKLVQNEELVPFVELRDEEFIYSKGKGSYTVKLKYSEIEEIKTYNYAGINRMKIQLTENRFLPIWLIIDQN